MIRSGRGLFRTPPLLYTILHRRCFFVTHYASRSINSTQNQESFAESNNNFDDPLSRQLENTIKSADDTIQVPYKSIFSSSIDLDKKLLQNYLLFLLQRSRIDETATLMCVLFEKDTNFILSDEYWSIFISKVCEHAHFLGAKIVYHEIIDNHRFHTQEYLSEYNDANFMLPFLISNALLEDLAFIFAQNKDPRRIQGLLDYFRRFYSYSGQQQTYKTLKIAVVEAHSNLGDTASALETFKSLCMVHKGNYNFKSSRKYLRSIKSSSFNAFRERREVIKENYSMSETTSSEKRSMTLLDEVEEKNLKLLDIEPFDPCYQRNMYETPSNDYIPLVNGTLKVQDLPYFRQLIYDNVKYLMHSSESDPLVNLINTVKSTHSMLHLYINSCLIDLGYIKEAYQLLLKLPAAYPNIILPVLIPDENYVLLFKASKSLLLSSNDDAKTEDSVKSLLSIMIDIKEFYISSLRSVTRSHVSSVVYMHFLSALLAIEGITFEYLKPHLEEYISFNKGHRNSTIYLGEDDYVKMRGLFSNFERTKYSKFIKPKFVYS